MYATDTLLLQPLDYLSNPPCPPRRRNMKYEKSLGRDGGFGQDQFWINSVEFLLWRSNTDSDRFWIKVDSRSILDPESTSESNPDSSLRLPSDARTQTKCFQNAAFTFKLPLTHPSLPMSFVSNTDHFTLGDGVCNNIHGNFNVYNSCCGRKHYREQIGDALETTEPVQKHHCREAGSKNGIVVSGVISVQAMGLNIVPGHCE
ncbi:hypothetical protein B0H17DRAFT_1132838 [Mycena rosella]|uniref:Uncharacterized protein n=1 Tax=Mycena rosella TaxID=1033263 RepID=A0AAD7GFS9_MYCRO|nr:hypothetical protein B0H17DRAFT_1132838 [Mycena rosella]